MTSLSIEWRENRFVACITPYIQNCFLKNEHLPASLFTRLVRSHDPHNLYTCHIVIKLPGIIQTCPR